MIAPETEGNETKRKIATYTTLLSGVRTSQPLSLLGSPPPLDYTFLGKTAPIICTCLYLPALQPVSRPTVFHRSRCLWSCVLLGLNDGWFGLVASYFATHDWVVLSHADEEVGSGCQIVNSRNKHLDTLFHMFRVINPPFRQSYRKSNSEYLCRWYASNWTKLIQI